MFKVSPVLHSVFSSVCDGAALEGAWPGPGAMAAEPNPDDFPTLTPDQLTAFRDAFMVKDHQNHGHPPGAPRTCPFQGL